MKLKRPSKWVGLAAIIGFAELNLTEGWVTVDCETTGLDPRGALGVDRDLEPARPFFVSVCDPDGNVAWTRFEVDAYSRKSRYHAAAELRAILEKPRIAKVFWNRPFDQRMLEAAGFSFKGEMVDAMLAMHVAKADLISYALKKVSKQLLGFDDGDEGALGKSAQRIRNKVSMARRRIRLGKAKDDDAQLALIAINHTQDEDEDYKADYWLAEHTLLEKYGCNDALRTAQMWVAIKDMMDEDMAAGVKGSKLWETFREEQELQDVVMSMEDRGIAVDRDKCLELKSYYGSIQEASMGFIQAEAGTDFNPRSNPQLQREFFVNRGIQPTRWVVDKGKKEPNPCQHCKGRGCEVCHDTGHNPRCDGDFLVSIGTKRELAEGGEERVVMADRLAYHMLRLKAAKAMADFSDSYLRFMVKEQDGWVIHPSYRQCEAVTHRFSCARPNMQNVADDDSGKKKIDVPYRPREAFVPRPGHVLIAPDYSQIEIWLLMLRSMDPTLRQMLLAGGDLHGRVASTLWGNDFNLDDALHDKKAKLSALTKAQLANLKRYVNKRKRSKNIQFCKIYGGGAARIAEMIGCTLAEAEKFIADWEKLFSGVAGYMARKIREARAYGWSENAYGYKYPIERGLEYRAVNYDIQGSAARLIKRAMIRVGTTAKRINVVGPIMCPLLTIHDELLIEIIDDKKVIYDCSQFVVQDMQADWELLECPVPFPVGMKIIEKNWAEAREIKL
jgi:DNA polymerase I-like protein with 3'-5' exonuclease and polymerase domains